MGLSTPNGGEKKPRPLIPIGPQPAVLYGIIDIGTHVEQTNWGEKKAPKVMFFWEFVGLPEMVFDEAKGPQRLNQIQEYNFYSDEKANIVKALKSWRGVQKINFATDLPAYMGQGCQLMIEQYTSKKDGELKSRIMSGGAIILPPNGNYGPPKNPMVFFDLDKFSWTQFHTLYPFVQKKIKMSLEWNGILQKFGAEPLNPHTKEGKEAAANGSFQAMGNVNNQQMPQNTNFQQQGAPQVVQQFQQPVQQMQQAPSFANPVQQQAAPQFHSGHGNNQPVSNVNTQQFAPQVQETGIIVDNGTPPSF